MKNFKKVFAVLAACTMAAGMISVAACTPEEPGPGPDGPGIVTPVEVSVTVNPTTKSIEAEQTFEITATVTNSDKNPVWESSNPAVATVAGTGKKAVVTAVAAGTANITATVDGKKATCALTVTAKPVVVEELTLDKEYEVLEASGDKATATLTATNIGDGVTFTSSDPEVVTVTAEEGVATLTAVKLGAATITAVSGDFTKTCKVEVANAGLKYTLTKVGEEGNETDALMVADGDTKVEGELRIPAIYYSEELDEYLPVVKVGTEGFKGNNNITTVYTGDNVNEILDNGFSNCKSLLSVKCGPAMKVIGGGAFDGSTALATFDWGESQPTRIVRCAFRFVSLTEFVMPESLNGIGDSLFQGATLLETVKIHGEVSIIYGSTFLNCSALTNVYLPDTVTSIGDAAFSLYSNDGLNQNLTVHYKGTEEQWGKIVISESNAMIIASKNPGFKINYNAEY